MDEEALRRALRSVHRGRSAHRLEGRHLASRARVPGAGRRRDHSRAGLQRVSGRNAARERRAVSLSRCVRARTSSSTSTRSRATCCDRTRILYLNYPNNPTAAIAPRDYLEHVVARCRELDILLVYDNAYSEIAFDGYVPPSIFEIDGARDVAIEFHSLSKTYNMTGWRCGWAVARPEIASALLEGEVVHRHGAVHGDPGGRRRRARELGRVRAGQRRDLQGAARRGRDAFRAAGFECEVPRATMYLWIPLPDGIPSARCSPSACSRRRASS